MRRNDMKGVDKQIKRLKLLYSKICPYRYVGIKNYIFNYMVQMYKFIKEYLVKIQSTSNR